MDTNHREPIAPPRRIAERDGASENGSDSDVVVVHARSSRELRDSGATLSGTLTESLDSCDTVVIEVRAAEGGRQPWGMFSSEHLWFQVVHLQIDDEAELLKDPQVQLIYIDYRFLEQTIETPFNIPKSSLKNTGNKVNFNFRKGERLALLRYSDAESGVAITFVFFSVSLPLYLSQPSASISRRTITNVSCWRACFSRTTRVAPTPSPSPC